MAAIGVLKSMSRIHGSSKYISTVFKGYQQVCNNTEIFRYGTIKLPFVESQISMLIIIESMQWYSRSTTDSSSTKKDRRKKISSTTRRGSKKNRCSAQKSKN